MHDLRGLVQRVRHAARRLGGGLSVDAAELDLFPSEHQRKEAVRRSAVRLVGRRHWIMATAAAVSLSLGMTLVLRNAAASLGLPISKTVTNLILAVPVLICCSALGIWMMKRQSTKLLRLELLSCGVPVCLRCGYHLLGAPGPGCPECGRPLDERVCQILGDDPLQSPERKAD